MNQSKVASVEITRFQDAQRAAQADLLVVEEPLEIRLGFGSSFDRQQKSVSVTMRTPGQDLELAIGFLFTEGIVQSPSEVRDIAHCLNVERPEEVGNVVKVELEAGVEVDWERLQRNFYTTSSCGVCGKASLEAVALQACPQLPAPEALVRAEILAELPPRARNTQTVFAHTGGIHAASLFDPKGELLLSCEDVGRHNAFDKLIGAEFMAGRLPRAAHIALASGRLSFELVQKTLRAGIPVLAAVGAPSSLAVALAREHGMTLCGFVREGRFNVYTVPERISWD